LNELLRNLSPEKKARVLWAAKQLALIKKNNPARYYVPNGKSEEFIKLVGANKHFVSLFLAANGVGKTCTGANMVGNICYGPQSKWFNSPLYNDFPYLKRGRIISDPTTIEEKIVPELHKWLPKGKYETSKAGKTYESQWKTSTGFEFDLMSNEQDAKEFESVDLGWAWFDEPPRWDVFKATVARMRRGGMIFMTLTPLMHSAWIKDELVDKAKDKSVAYVTADVEANCKQHGVRGILEHKDIDRMIAQYDADEKLARIEGKFGHLIGLIFKMFERNIHVIEPFDINHREFSVYHALDPHPRVEDAGMWLGVDKKGTKYVVDELFVKVDSDRELAFQIKQKNDKYRLESMIADPSMFVANQHESASLATKLQGHGLYYHEASKLRQAADRRIKDALTFQEVKGHMVRAPELYIFSTCQRTIFEIERYRWDNWRGRTGEDKTPKPKPVDKDDHMVENLGRLLLNEPVFVPVVEQRQQTQIINDDPY